MKTNIFFSKIVHLFTIKGIKTKMNEVDKTVHELIHPRFFVDKSAETIEKNTNESLLFQMYSKENNTLFI